MRGVSQQKVVFFDFLVLAASLNLLDDRAVSVSATAAL
jgi:hypothetical protein